MFTNRTPAPLPFADTVQAPYDFAATIRSLADLAYAGHYRDAAAVRGQASWEGEALVVHAKDFGRNTTDRLDRAEASADLYYLAQRLGEAASEMRVLDEACVVLTARDLAERLTVRLLAGTLDDLSETVGIAAGCALSPRFDA